MSQLPRSQRPLTHWSNAEITEELERVTGFPAPAYGTSNFRELLAEHEVASRFLLYHSHSDDPQQARRESGRVHLAGACLPG